MDTIEQSIARLAAARGAVMDDLQSEVYLERFRHADADLFARAVRVLMDQPRGEFEPAMPPVAALLHTMGNLQRQDAEQEHQRRSKSHKYACDVCRDTQWISHACLGNAYLATSTVPDWAILRRGPEGVILESMPVRECDRWDAHTAHSYVRRCACYVPRQMPIAPEPKHSGRSRTAKRHSDPYAGTTVDVAGR